MLAAAALAAMPLSIIFTSPLQEFIDQVRDELEQAPAEPPNYRVQTQMTESGQVTYFTHVTQHPRRVPPASALNTTVASAAAVAPAVACNSHDTTPKN